MGVCEPCTPDTDEFEVSTTLSSGRFKGLVMLDALAVGRVQAVDVNSIAHQSFLLQAVHAFAFQCGEIVCASGRTDLCRIAQELGDGMRIETHAGAQAKARDGTFTQLVHLGYRYPK
jgi:hypothetical protein